MIYADVEAFGNCVGRWYVEGCAGGKQDECGSLAGCRRRDKYIVVFFEMMNAAKACCLLLSLCVVRIYLLKSNVILFMSC